MEFHLAIKFPQFLLPSYVYIKYGRISRGCLKNFYYDVGRQGLEIYPCKLFVSYMHASWLRLFFVVFRDFNHNDVHQVRELYLSIKFHACRYCS